MKKQFSSPLILAMLLALALLPSFYCLLSYFREREELLLLQGKVCALRSHKTYIEKAQSQDLERLEKLRRADVNYLQKEIEPLLFLRAEKKRLHVLSSSLHSQIQSADEEEKNRLIFIQKSLQPKPPFQETLYQIKHPVELNLEDLKILLTKLEKCSAPEFRFKRFELLRKALSPTEEVFSIQFELIKRELLNASTK